ncbi:uncharacterized protein [Bos taurus]|uniref:uncharacterized protein n=1 Tax=Bos taurus TaxID=9913 RepID=UPI0028CB6B68|nr:uncharacterized protein LOC132345853 [Bos taurus]
MVLELAAEAQARADQSRKAGREKSPGKLAEETFWERTRDKLPLALKDPQSDRRCARVQLTRADSPLGGSPFATPHCAPGPPAPPPSHARRRAEPGPDRATSAGGAVSPDSRSPAGPPGRTLPTGTPRLPVAPEARG